MRRLPTGFIVLLLLVLPACGEEAPARERITLAAATTQEAGTARIRFESAVTGGPGGGFTMTGEGAVDFAAQRGSMTFDLGEAAAQTGLAGKIETLFEGTVLYVRIPNAQQLGLPTPWLKVDLEKTEGLEGIAQLEQFRSDPSDTLAYLEGVTDEITEVGPEDVRGEPTTHYTAVVDLERAIEQAPQKARATIRQQLELLGSPTLPVDVWIDDDGLLRRQSFTIDLTKAAASAEGPLEGADGASVKTTMELYDFGAPVEVAPPPAGEVTDYADIGKGAGG